MSGEERDQIGQKAPGRLVQDKMMGKNAGRFDGIGKSEAAPTEMFENVPECCLFAAEARRAFPGEHVEMGVRLGDPWEVGRQRPLAEGRYPDEAAVSQARQQAPVDPVPWRRDDGDELAGESILHDPPPGLEFSQDLLGAAMEAELPGPPALPRVILMGKAVLEHLRGRASVQSRRQTCRQEFGHAGDGDRNACLPADAEQSVESRGGLGRVVVAPPETGRLAGIPPTTEFSIQAFPGSGAVVAAPSRWISRRFVRFALRRIGGRHPSGPNTWISYRRRTRMALRRPAQWSRDSALCQFRRAGQSASLLPLRHHGRRGSRTLAVQALSATLEMKHVHQVADGRRIDRYIGFAFRGDGVRQIVAAAAAHRPD